MRGKRMMSHDDSSVGVETKTDMDPMKLIPYAEFDWERPSEYTKIMIRPWRFIEGGDPNNYAYNTTTNKWMDVSERRLGT
jgi:hypothetical protein